MEFIGRHEWIIDAVFLFLVLFVAHKVFHISPSAALKALANEIRDFARLRPTVGSLNISCAVLVAGVSIIVIMLKYAMHLERLLESFAREDVAHTIEESIGIEIGLYVTAGIVAASLLAVTVGKGQERE